jgi:dienelactone hydrolase
MSIALGAIIREADLAGAASFHNVVIRYRDEFLRVLRTEGKDAEREAGRLGLDEVESYLKASILPRLVGDGVIKAVDGDPVTSDLTVQLTESLWRDIEPNKREIAEVFRHTGEYSAIEAQKPAKVVVGGKSMGGRIASMVADELGVRGLICLGYPFHPPGRPEQLRTAHLTSLRTPALIIQGTRDQFGTEAEVSAYELSKSIRIEWMKDGDHSFKPRAGSGTTERQNLERAVGLMEEFFHTNTNFRV